MIQQIRPCYGCEDRYRACQDTCTKPEYLIFREKYEKEKKERKHAEEMDSFAAYGSLCRSKRNPRSVFATHKRRG